MPPKTDETPPKGVLGTTTLNKTRYTINCATCGKKEVVRAESRTAAWAAFQESGWVAFAEPSSPTPTYVECGKCAVSE
jgi:hypothetical protein